MATVRYTGLSGIRAFTKKDFESVDVTDQEGVKFAGPNLHDIAKHKGVVEEAEVSEAAAEFLLSLKEDGRKVFKSVSTEEGGEEPDDEVYTFGGDSADGTDLT